MIIQDESLTSVHCSHCHGVHRNNKKRHLDSLWTMTHEKCIKLNAWSAFSWKTQTQNPGFQPLLNPGFGFGKWLGFPGPRFFKTRVSIPNFAPIPDKKYQNFAEKWSVLSYTKIFVQKVVDTQHSPISVLKSSPVRWGNKVLWTMLH